MLNIIFFSPLEHHKLEVSPEKLSYISCFPKSPHFWLTTEEQFVFPSPIFSCVEMGWRVAHEE